MPLDSKGREIVRCHWCAATGCEHNGERRIPEGGCPDFNRLDPALRPSKWVGKRRIKKMTTIMFTEENRVFIERFVVPSNEKKHQGHFNRGVESVINDRLARCGDEIPLIPKIERGSGKLRGDKKITLSPECMASVRAIVKHFEGTENRTSISQVVNFFTDQIRYESQKLRESNNG
jgi:hypothetical protein